MKTLRSQVEMVEQLPDSDVFSIGGLTYRLVWEDYHKYKTTEDEIVLLKSWPFLELEYAVFSALAPQVVVEFGIFEGGSAFLWRELLGCDFIGIDIAPDNPILREIVRRKNWEGSLVLHFNCSQDDATAINGLLETHCKERSIDLVIDDASHQYMLSRRTFEIMFPYLGNGGIYTLEDWSWAHFASDFWQKERFWRENPALTNLVFDLSVLVASKPDWFDSMDLRSDCAFIHKSRQCPELPDLNFDRDCISQGRKLVPI